MNNWKIGTRIAAGFAVVILIATSLGLFAYGKVQTINKSSTLIVTNTLSSVFLVGQIHVGVMNQYSLLLQHLSSTTKATMERVETEILTARARNGEILA